MIKKRQENIKGAKEDKGSPTIRLTVIPAENYYTL